MNILHELRPLTDEERIAAQERAREIVILQAGKRPERSSFRDYSISKYPSWFTKLTGLFMAIVFVAAAAPSLFRLYTAGREYFLHGINDQIQASIVGVSTFLLAEFLIILSTIAAKVYFTGRERLLFVVPITIGLLMALVGNHEIAKPGSFFGWLETLAPPLSVLVIAIIGERQILAAIEARHSSEKAYQEALAEWAENTARPEESSRYMSAYANSLRAALMSANNRGRSAQEKRELMATLRGEQWRALVQRELRAEEWYLQTDQEESEQLPPVNPTIQLLEPEREKVLSNGNSKH